MSADRMPTENCSQRPEAKRPRAFMKEEEWEEIRTKKNLWYPKPKPQAVKAVRARHARPYNTILKDLMIILNPEITENFF